MEARNQAFVERFCASILSEQQLAQLSLDPAERQEVQQRVAQQAEASTQAATLAAEASRQAQHYEAEARLVQEVLEVAGLPLDSLSARAQLCASLIAGVCGALGLARPGLPEVLAAWAQVKLRESRAVVLQAKLKQHSAEVERDASRARARLQQLQAALAKVQHQQHAAERRARAEGQQVAELEAKQQEYGKTLEKCARKLAANGAVPEIHHSTLVEKRAALQELQARAADLQQQLASYHSLPPSALGAGMMLQQARERLRAAQERLESGLADL
ncbi:hypothetical protein MNEG_10459 [Monoraphidium neglectum]|uniref:Uncharacterized protein n=1 Tax=Monoraphidium neglectum TaxID=145388 RepID=A0A0D2M1G0_9CHLO|nr:hypothetical protein MNEG_10459 [Monoraphidium neglectum]KIY97504.1 hypothetical protein MNEG_10459 [Monoraphidium neglectum]|eukprot:XP_013896524.1 hypothetical protein MNEG_10459 [Monoraphidium neglectum]